MLNKSIYKLVFIDIETTSEEWENVPAKSKELFAQAHKRQIDEVAKDYYDALKAGKKAGEMDKCFEQAYRLVWNEKAHLSPEFGSIICVSVGVILNDFKFQSKSFTGDNDKEILTSFLAKTKFIHQEPSKADQIIAGHNIKNWDIPFLAKRIMYNGLSLPSMLDTGNLKPWEMNHVIDTKEHLKFGGMDSPSLETISCILNVPTAETALGLPNQLKEWHKKKETVKIAQYCEMDVYAAAQCYLKLIRSSEHPNGILNQLTKS